MFDSADLDHRMDKSQYRREEPLLRRALLDAQYALASRPDFPVLIIIGGVDGAGKGETVNLLNEWMDPRHIHTHAFAEPSSEEAERPPMWRYWRVLPPKGNVGIFFGSWYTSPLLRRVLGEDTQDALDSHVAAILRHERMLVDEGVLLIKFWFHLSKDQQRKRLKALESDHTTRWRVTPEEWQRFRKYDRFRRVSADVVRQTSTAGAPWIVVPGADHRYRSITVGKVLLNALQARLAHVPEARTEAAPPLPQLENVRLLRDLDLTRKLSKRRYESRLEKLQGDLNQLSRAKRFRERALAVVFEGSDAAGKGSTIRRVTAALDARFFRVIPIAAPTEEERAQPYLWRFWRHLPRHGRITLFDRSWYGRVLVERVEGFCSQPDWMRAYSEINDFEDQIAASGTVLAKFWLHISADEQLRRFKEREEIAHKQFKITADDWRNRERRDAYEAAVADMVDRTSSRLAPWTLVEAEDKNYGRIKVLQTLVDQLDAAL
ncbi:MAG: polyphosphate:AMP phosphotransferase [Pseudomarimonas sp.]